MNQPADVLYNQLIIRTKDIELTNPDKTTATVNVKTDLIETECFNVIVVIDYIGTTHKIDFGLVPLIDFRDLAEHLPSRITLTPEELLDTLSILTREAIFERILETIVSKATVIQFIKERHGDKYSFSARLHAQNNIKAYIGDTALIDESIAVIFRRD